MPTLETSDMLNVKAFEARIQQFPWKPIMEVADFNGIIALSQEYQVPVYEISRAQADQQGAVWEQTKKAMDVFEHAFTECAERIFKLTA